MKFSSWRMVVMVISERVRIRILFRVELVSW